MCDKGADSVDFALLNECGKDDVGIGNYENLQEPCVLRQSLESEEDIVRNICLDGIMGVVVGDALGVPAEFSSREELVASPVTDMRGYGTYGLPKGTWSDDSSMTLAALDSLRSGYNPDDMMIKFAKWRKDAEYTPYGKVFDAGITCTNAINRYLLYRDITGCGGYEENDNGNGSLMRIMPMCLYVYEKQKQEAVTDEEAIKLIHEVSALTHGHLRSKIACGLYFFMARSILEEEGTLIERMQHGLAMGFCYYEQSPESTEELKYYRRIRDLEELKGIPVDEIMSSGYVVASLEASLWCLARTSSYEEATLMAVNLGHDTDTVAAIAGGLAGLYYGYEGIPAEWLNVIAKREWVEGLCKEAGNI